MQMGQRISCDLLTFFLQGWSRLAWRSNRYYGWWTVALLWKFFVSQKPVRCIIFNYLLCNGKYYHQCCIFILLSAFMSVITTIMDKSVGTVLQFERFLIHVKLYPRATNTARPYPLPPHHGQCWNHEGTIPLIFQHCIGWGRGRGHAFVKWHHCFLRHYLWNA